MQNPFELNVFFRFVETLFKLELRKLLCSEYDCNFHLIYLQYSLQVGITLDSRRLRRNNAISLQWRHQSRSTERKNFTTVLILHYFCFRGKSYLFVNTEPQRRPNTLTVEERHNTRLIILEQFRNC